MNESVIMDHWLKTILEFSQLTLDHRFKKWAKYITDCDMDRDDGYMFEGEWIGPGTVQVPTGHHRIILTCAISGSNKYHYRHFRVLIMKPDTTLEFTDIFTDDHDKGWALRLKPVICTLLETLEQRDQGILTPRDRVHLAAESFSSVVSQLPEDEQIKWFSWLLQGKDDQFLPKVGEMLVKLNREVNNV